MSYEHCDIHDCDATNGCPACTEASLRQDARDAVEPLVDVFRKHLDRLAMMNDHTMHLIDPLELVAEKLAVAAFRLGRGYGPE